MLKRIISITWALLFVASGFAQEKAATTGQVKPENFQVKESAKIPMVAPVNPASGPGTSGTVDTVDKIKTKPIATSAKRSGTSHQEFGTSAPHKSSKTESIAPDKSLPTAIKGTVNSETTPVPVPAEASRKVN